MSSILNPSTVGAARIEPNQGERGLRRLSARAIVLASLVAVFVHPACDAEMPRIMRETNRVDLMVDGKPWLMLGGELRNSSSSTAEFMKPIWPHLQALNLNTVFLPISWRLLEPQEGKFDFALLDSLLKQARQYHLRLVLLWMGSWKNGVSGYTPGWVLSQPQRFPRMAPSALSPFGEANVQADSRAFCAVLHHLRKSDGARHTVLMMQVENEIGFSRDRTPLGEAAFNGPVPQPLLKHLALHEAELQPYVRDLWVSQGRKTRGTWTEIFGSGLKTDDLFMAWHFASYVERLAAAGKAVYPLPMYVNAAQLLPGRNQTSAEPGGGGPVDRVLDTWMAAAPSIDLYAVDNYRNFKPQCAAYRHRGNPLFMPECCSWWQDDPYSSPAKCYYAIAEQDALAFSPFGIDNEMYRGHMLGLAYRKLTELMPLLANSRGTGRMHGFYRGEPKEKGETFTFNGYRAAVTYRELPLQGAPAGGVSIAADPYGCFGLIIQTGDDEFIVSARGADIRFASTDEKRLYTINLGVEEGDFVYGLWKAHRLLSGDEVGGQGAQCTLTPPPFSKQRVIGEEPLTILKLRMARLASLAPAR